MRRESEDPDWNSDWDPLLSPAAAGGLCAARPILLQDPHFRLQPRRPPAGASDREPPARAAQAARPELRVRRSGFAMHTGTHRHVGLTVTV